jgi:glycosyltransferase involved in cell wall biosynthesis
MRILIASGIYPPDIGGPAQYARNLYETWKSQGHSVKVAAYRWERAFPPIVRHILFFLKIFRKGYNADLILVLDTWSAAVPTMCACALMNKRYLIRSGGDALWESYVERTGDLVFFRYFYKKSLNKLSFKEKMMFSLGGKALRRAKRVIFSTKWQRDIFSEAYSLDNKKLSIVENYFGKRVEPRKPEQRIYVSAGRTLKLKNMENLRVAFEKARVQIKKLNLPDISLDCSRAIHDSYFEKIRNAYAVIVASLSEISPNTIIEAIQAGTPYIVTKENGLMERIGKTSVTVDPLDIDDMSEKIVWLSDPQNRSIQADKILGINFVHEWSDISKEIIDISLSK